MATQKSRANVLLIKPYQKVKIPVSQPPLGILYLAAGLREKLEHVQLDIQMIDMRLEGLTHKDLSENMLQFQPDIVGISALNFEAEESANMAQKIRRIFPNARIAIGGPHAHSNGSRLAEVGLYDWIFTGEADHSFPETVATYLEGGTDFSGIRGLIWRNGTTYTTNECGTSIENLDALPFPAWDLVDFDRYAAKPNQNGNLKGKRYAPLFTSRGCPYLCSYCHDIFGKKFRYRSAENVLEEIQLLRTKYGVDELQIIDDIFNLHRPRMKKICHALENQGLHLCFPNGLRADILTEEDVDALARAGTYQACVAVETVTPRLQELVQKNLDIERLRMSIHWFAQRNVLVKGFFMIGFPTETEQEIEDTIRYAIESDLTFAGFYLVIPQRGTNLYQLAATEAKGALERVLLGDYYSASCWYQEAYGVNLQAVQRRAFWRFYLSRPSRILRILRNVRLQSLVRGFRYWAGIVTKRGNDIVPEALESLTTVHPSEVETPAIGVPQ